MCKRMLEKNPNNYDKQSNLKGSLIYLSRTQMYAVSWQGRQYPGSFAFPSFGLSLPFCMRVPLAFALQENNDYFSRAFFFFLAIHFPREIRWARN